MRHTEVLLAALILCMIPAAAGEENVTELRIEDVLPDVAPGSFLRFSFSVGNQVGPPCDAKIDYWLETKGQKLAEAQDSLALATGETRKIDSFLLVPPEASGTVDFYLLLQCDGATAMARRSIRILNPAQTTPMIVNLKILKNIENERFYFSYTLKSTMEESQPITIEEAIKNHDEILWDTSQQVMLAGTEDFTREGPMLPPGQYTLSVVITRNGETSRAISTFEVKPTDLIAGSELNLSTLLPILAVALFSVTAVVVGGKFVRPWFRKTPSDEGVTFSPGHAGPLSSKIVTAITAARESAPQPAKNYVCMVESDAGGLLEGNDLNRLLDDAGFSREEKKASLEFATATPVSQSVRSAVFIDKFDKPNCETKIKITVNNETDKDWCNALLLARIPTFLSENVSEVETSGELEAVKQGSILKLVIPRIDAMQAVTVSYSIAKWIPQAKANGIPLPAVVSYSEGQPLVAKIEKVEKKAKSDLEKKASLSYALSKKAGKKQSKKKKKET